MGENAILTEIIPLAGGEYNLSSRRIKGSQIYLQLKDESLLNAPALQELDGVKSWNLQHGQLVITLSDDKKVPVSILVLEVCVAIEYHQTTLSF